uniref:RNA-directed DNA polymerase n=1 Tax=Panagrolaimus davidi TaxID=227884 RepID=A0A914P713_9BILA
MTEEELQMEMTRDAASNDLVNYNQNNNQNCNNFQNLNNNPNSNPNQNFSGSNFRGGRAQNARGAFNNSGSRGRGRGSRYSINSISSFLPLFLISCIISTLFVNIGAAPITGAKPLPIEDPMIMDYSSDVSVYLSCNSPHVIKKYRMVRPHRFNCIPVKLPKYRKQSMEVFVPRTRQLILPIFDCYARSYEEYSPAFFKIWQSKSSKFLGFKRIHADDCRKYVTERNVNGKAFEPYGLDRYRSTGHYTSSDSEHQMATSYFIRVGIAQTMDLKYLVSPMVNLRTCEVQAAACVLANSTVIWDVPTKTDLCPVERAGIFTGLVTEDESMVLLEESQTALFFSKDPAPEEIVNCTSGGIIQMKNGVYIRETEDNLFTAPVDEVAAAQARARVKRARKKAPILFEGEFLDKSTSTPKPSTTTPLTTTSTTTIPTATTTTSTSTTSTMPTTSSTTTTSTTTPASTTSTTTPATTTTSSTSTTATTPTTSASTTVTTTKKAAKQAYTSTLPASTAKAKTTSKVTPSVTAKTTPLTTSTATTVTATSTSTTPATTTSSSTTTSTTPATTSTTTATTSTTSTSTTTTAEATTSTITEAPTSPTTSSTSTTSTIATTTTTTTELPIASAARTSPILYEGEFMGPRWPETATEPTSMVTTRRTKDSAGFGPDQSTALGNIEIRSATMEDLKLTALQHVITKYGFSIKNGAGIPQALPLTDADWKIPNATNASSTDTRQMSNFVNSRIQYAMQHFHDRSLRDYNTLWQHICAMNNKDVDTSLALLQLSATEGVRKWMADRTITAEWEGETLLVSQCSQIRPDKIHWELKADGICYSKPPAMIAGKMYFVDLSKQEIVDKAETINCNDRPLLIRQLNNGTYTNGRRRFGIFNKPMNLSFTPDESQIQLYASSMFQSDLNNLVASTEVMERYLNRILDYQLEVVDTQTSIGLNGDLLEVLAVFVEALANETEKHLNTFSGFLDDPFAAAKNLMNKWYAWVVFICTIVLVVIIVYFTRHIWWYLLVKASNQLKFKKKTNDKELKELAVALRSTNPLKEALLSKDKKEQKRVIAAVALQIDEQQQAEEQKPANDGFITFIPQIYSIGTHDGHQGQPFVNIRLQNKQVLSLIDTGANTSLIRKSTLPQYNLSMSPTPNASGLAANKTKIEFLGQITANVKIGKYAVEAVLFVTEDDSCPAPILVGTNILSQLPDDDVSFSFRKRIVRVGNVKLPMVNNVKVEKDEPDEPWIVESRNYITLEPHSETIFQGFIAEAEPGDLVHVYEAHTNAPEDVLLARSVAKVSDKGIIPVRFMNTTNATIQLRPHQKIAFAEKTAEEHISPAVYHVAQPPENEPYVSKEFQITDKLPPLPDPNYNILDHIDVSDSTLSNKGKARLIEIIKRNQAAFVGPDGVVGCFKGKYKFKIPLIDEKAVAAQRPRRIPPALQAELQRQIDDLLKQGIIEPSESEFCAPVVLVRKADKKSIRFCCDFRFLNKLTKKRVFLLPLATEILDLVGGKKFFSTFDFQSGFHMIPIDKADRHKTAFSVFNQLYQWTRIPFGVMHGPQGFTDCMEEMRKFITAVLYIYIDDTILASYTEEEHLKNIEQFLQVVIQFGLKLKASKCKFGVREVRFLGLLVSEDGIRPDEKNISAVNNFTPPKTLTELRGFIGCTGYFRRFIPNFAEIMYPLYELTKQGTESVADRWKEEHQKAFELIKKKLVTSPVLAAPRFSQNFIIESDASSKAIAAVLLQKQPDGSIRPISYASRKLTKAEANYPSIESEGLALCYALETFRPYIEGTEKSVIITDNQPLVALLKSRNLTGRMARMALAIQHADVEIKYRPGKFNVVADFCSRYPGDQPEPEINAVSIIPVVDKQQIIEAQATDDTAQKLIKIIRDQVWPEKDDAFKSKYRFLLSKLKVQENLLIYQGKSHRQNALFIPEKLRKEIYLDFHSSPIQGAHTGVDKTYNKMKSRCFWPCMKDDIAKWIKNCPSCQKRKIQPNDRIELPLCPLPVPEIPFHTVHTDIIGPIPQTESNNKYILVTVCSFSKFVIASPMEDMTADTVARNFLNYVVCQHSVPSLVVSDQGRQFTAIIFKELSNSMGFTHRLTSVYNPESNGQVERNNRSIAAMLHAYVNAQSTDWDIYLQLIIFALNTSIQESTRFSAFELVFGRQPQLPTDLALELNPSANYSTNFREQMHRAIRGAWKEARQNILVAQGKQKKFADQRRKPKEKEIAVGDKILIFNDHLPAGSKFSDRWTGPFEVIKEHRHKVQYQQGQQLKWAHKKKVKIFHEMQEQS